jgi:hypothetical protein
MADDQTKPAAEAPEQQPDTPAPAAMPLDAYELYAARLMYAEIQRADLTPPPPGTTLH